MKAWTRVGIPTITAAALAVARPCLDPQGPIELKLARYAGAMRSLQVDVGGKPGTFLFDTGGGVTVLSTAAAKRLACPVFGRGTGFRHDGTRVDGSRGGPVDLGIGAFRWRGEVGVLDLDAMLQGLPKVEGMLCLETFAGRILTVDYARDRLLLETADSLAERTHGAKELAVRVAHQAGGASLDLFVAIEGKHGRLWFELDSGNTQGVLVADHAWSELGIDAPPVGQVRKIDLPIVGLGKLQCTAAPKELIYDGLLDIAFFERHVLTIDLERGRAWATTN